MALRDIVLDAYATLSHKAPIGDGTNRPDSLAPTWIPARDQRRIDAYKVLAAYRLNNARFLVRAPVTGVDDRAVRREYGDADLLVDRVVAGVLGDTFEIVVDGADADLPDQPDLPPEPAPPADGASSIEQRVHAIRTARWEQAANEIVDDWERSWAEQPALLERQQWLRDWADAVLLPSLIVESEGDTVGLGDGVYTLALSTAKRRAVVEVYDPGMYFPVLSDDSSDYPTKVHVAWETLPDVDGKKFIRRLTWELGPITPVLEDDGTPAVVEEQLLLREFPTPAGPVRDRFASPADIAVGAAPGSIVRDYPWSFDPEGNPRPSSLTCYFTDATWRWEDLGPRHADDFDEAKASFAFTDEGLQARRLDLRIDFLPVVHIPNTPAHRDHYGRSVLSIVSQILDDISISDTDVQEAAGLAAGPAIALSGSKAAADLTVRPGAIYNVGENGRMDVLDMSAGLAELRSVRGELLDRLSVNGRVPAEVLGRTDATQAMPGISILLRFGPFIQLVGMLRMTREPKYQLLLKFASRLAQAGGFLEAGPDIPARIAFGSFLPSDRSQLVEEVAALLNAKAISRQTAVALLVAGGLTIDDAQGEVDRIKADDPAAAKDVADATGSEQAAAEWLGIEIPAAPARPVVPAVTLPPPTPPAP